jgi:hypothetical protein
MCLEQNMKMRNRVKITLTFFAIPLVFFMLNHAIGQQDHEYPPAKKNNVHASGSGGLTDGTKEHRVAAGQTMGNDERIIRHPMQGEYVPREVNSREPRAINERNTETHTHSLILLEPQGERVAASFVSLFPNVTTSLFPYFTFHDYYILNDRIYYIFSENGMVYLGSSTRKHDGSFVRNGKEEMVGLGIMSLYMPRKKFIAPENSHPLRIELGNAVDHKIYEINSSGEFDLIEYKPTPGYDYEGAAKVKRLTKNTLPLE